MDDSPRTNETPLEDRSAAPMPDASRSGRAAAAPLEDEATGSGTSLPPAGNASIGGITQSLDLSTDVANKKELAPEPADDYDSRTVEDGARRTIAYLLIGLLWLLVAAILVLLAWHAVDIKDLKEFCVLLSPIVVLVSASTGFYYGTKSSGN